MLRGFDTKRSEEPDVVSESRPLRSSPCGLRLGRPFQGGMRTRADAEGRCYAGLTRSAAKSPMSFRNPALSVLRPTGYAPAGRFKAGPEHAQMPTKTLPFGGFRLYSA